MIAFLLGTKTGRALSIAGLVVLAIIGARIWLVAHDNAIRQAEADKCRARIENMVSKAEADAITAMLARERQRAAAAEAMATEEKTRAEAALRAKESQDARLAKLLEDASKAPGLSLPTSEDLQWLERSR